ncbi:MAG TPA: beta-ketoacyl-[acyl-carrier-protein] synthase II, partial [Phycisphaerae bacterium]
SIEHARRRGAAVLAYLRAAGITCDAHHLTAPEPKGVQAARAITDALDRAGLLPEEIDYVNAHGTGTRDNDAMESAAIRKVFCEDRLPAVSSTKRATGHTFGAAAAIEAIVCIQAIRNNLAPINAGSVSPDPAIDLPIVRGQSLRMPIRAAVSTNFAFGGNNTALVFADAPEGSP